MLYIHCVNNTLAVMHGRQGKRTANRKNNNFKLDKYGN